MDWKEIGKQLLELGQRMKLHGERLYPDWTWIVYPRDAHWELWVDDVGAVKARLVKFDENDKVISKRGILIKFGEHFLLEYLAMSNEEKLATIEHMLHGAIEEATLIAPGAVYPSYYPYYVLPDGRHEWKRE